MISTKRKPFPTGQSRAVTLPASMEISNEVSMAASDRLIIMDTTGEVPEAKLLQFFMKFVEPSFQNWWQAEKQVLKRPRGFRVMQAGTQAPAKAIQSPEPTVVKPEAQIQPVVCPRCAGQISWNLDQGLEGFCPYCGLFLKLTPGGEGGK
jgi:virulence-associated protein VagC